MEYTQNYALRKPGLNEYANVGDLNFNADKIDSQMKKNQDVDGEVYDPTTTSSNAYEAGDYVINPDDGLMYVCNGTTYGTWDATKWDHTTEFEEIQKAMASGGESELADLHDVDITNPTEGQVLTYDEQNDEWVNSDIPDADVTKTASGNPIEFSNGADAPLVKCVTQITGSQDLHGQDKPWVGGAGKNKCIQTVSGVKTRNSSLTWVGDSATLNGVTFTILSDNAGNVIGYNVNGTASELCTFSCDDDTYVASESVIVNGCPQGADGCSIDVWRSGSIIGKDTGSGVTVSAGRCAVSISVARGTTVDNKVFHPMIRLASVTDPTFAPYSNICPITAYTEGEIEVRGKNALDPLKVKTGFQYNPSVGTQFTLTDIADMTDNGGGTFSKTISGWYCFGYLFELPESECSFKIQYSGTGARVSYGFLDDSYTVLSSEYNSNTNQTITKSLAKTGTRKYFFFTATTNQTTADITFTEPQIEFGSTATTYSPYTSTTHTTTYPSAIYRGSEDVVGGSVETEHGFISFDGTESWADLGGYSNQFAIDITDIISIKIDGSGYALPSYTFTNMYEVATVNATSRQNGELTIYKNNSQHTILALKDTRFATLADFINSLGSVNLQLAYQLATPTTSSVTPTNTPIKSLYGYNHIESSTGEMEVEYIAKAFSPITEIVDSQISALSKMMELMLTSARETTMTASANYTTGTLIVACGALYKATTAISSGASLVVGTNITPTTIAEELAALA